MSKGCSCCADTRSDRRDFRQDKGGGPEEMPHRKQGGKGKWCGKKVGRVCEFTEKVQKWSSTNYRSYVMTCPVCHKHGDRYWTVRRVEYTHPVTGETSYYWTT